MRFSDDILNTSDRCNRPRCRLAALSAVASLWLCSGCLSVPPSPQSQFTNVVQISSDQRDVMWERAVDVLNRSHFTVARESKLEGVIESDYRAGANLLEPWHPDSVGVEQRLESTMQSIRRRVVISMLPTGPGLTTVSIRVDKEIEDLPGLAATYEGGATFPESQTFNRDLTQAIGQSAPSRWLPRGRDYLLEQKLMTDLQRP